MIKSNWTKLHKGGNVHDTRPHYDMASSLNIIFCCT
jgi:hypothetical protein